MAMVERRDAQTLLPIMQQHLRSGTIVHSDEWAAYNQAQRLEAVEQHQVVNHSLHFCRSSNGCPHTEHRILLEQGED